MKDYVTIKSYQNGLTLILDEDAPFEELIREIEFKFSESRNFFGNAKMALAIEGKKLNSAQELHIIEAIRKSCDIHIICLVGKDEDTNKFFLKALEQVEKRLSANDSQGQFYKGTLKNKQILETENNIVVLGDVYPGCAIISSKNIIVLGGLYGEAYAGGDGQEGHYIVALEMEPERLKIGDFKYKENGKNKWGLKPKVQPRIAYVNCGKFVIEPLTKELLGSF